jgi:hypothetical protein
MCARRLSACIALVVGLTGRSVAAELPKATEVELQPLAAQVHRLVEELDYLGAPLSETDKQVRSPCGAQHGGHCALARDHPQGKSTMSPFPLHGYRQLHGSLKQPVPNRCGSFDSLFLACISPGAGRHFAGIEHT